jgi:ATP-dependent Clp protease ATP-binding subunit ClpX
VTATTPIPSAIVKGLDEYIVGQEEAKKIVAVAVYAHFKKVAIAAADKRPILKSNLLLIGNSGTGKTLMCETLARILDVPFATAEATSLAQTRFVNEEIDAILQRLLERAGGDVEKAQHGIIFIDEIDKLRGSKGAVQATSGESVQHSLLKIMEGAAVLLADGRYLDTTNVLFVCGGAFVGLEQIISQTHGYGFIATGHSENRKILDRLNSRVKPTDLFTYGLIPEFTGRLPVIARFHDLTKPMLVRIMTEPANSLYNQFRELFRNEGVELVVEPYVFDQIAELSNEYKTGARSLRGIFEELISPVLYIVPDRPDLVKVVVRSLFTDAELITGPRRVAK